MDLDKEELAHLTFLSKKLPLFSLTHIRKFLKIVYAQPQPLLWQLSGGGDVLVVPTGLLDRRPELLVLAL